MTDRVSSAPGLGTTMALRTAQTKDLDTIAGIFAEAFWDEIVFGKLFHPYRAAFPQDYRRYWRHKVSEWYWDIGHQLIVSCIVKSNPEGRGEEILTGVADWMRLGKQSARERGSWVSRWCCKSLLGSLRIQGYSSV